MVILALTQAQRNVVKVVFYDAWRLVADVATAYNVKPVTLHNKLNSQADTVKLSKGQLKVIQEVLGCACRMVADVAPRYEVSPLELLTVIDRAG